MLSVLLLYFQIHSTGIPPADIEFIKEPPPEPKARAQREPLKDGPELQDGKLCFGYSERNDWEWPPGWRVVLAKNSIE